MASPNILGLNYKSNAFHVVVGLLCVMVLIEKSGASDFAIEWRVPTDPSVTHFNQWAENTRFQIGDAIVFNYPPGQDSVLRVSQDEYTNCNTNSSTAEKFTDGHTVYKFSQSGPFYFISGNGDNCIKNEKVVVIVLADRTNRNAATPPSPAPSSAESPPPAPSGTPETPSPESSIPPPPPSAASSVFVSLVGSIIGAFAASSTLLLV